MGQSSSQIAQQSQHVEIARTPTPELSDVDRAAPREQTDDDNVMETQSNHDHAPSIHWSPINVPHPNPARAAILSQAIASSQPASAARAKVPKKRASQSSQRRLLSPRISRVVPSAEGSDEELQSQRQRRSALPKAARSEEDTALSFSGQAKEDRHFSPLRKNKPQTIAHKSPTPYLSPARRPPQVLVPSSEIAEATRAQALENHVEKLQGQLSRAQIPLKSPAQDKYTKSGAGNTTATGNNVLAELQNNNQGNDWFAKIDEAVAEAEAAHSELADAKAQSGELRGRSAASDQAEGLASPTSPVPSPAVTPAKDRPNIGGKKTDSEEHEADQRMPRHASKEAEEVGEAVEELEDDEMDEDIDDEQTWPEPTEDKVKEYQRQRKLTNHDLEMEERIENPQSKWESYENERRGARNALREYIVELSLARKIYKGLAQYVTDDDGETSVAYAADGEKFPIANHTKAEKKEAKAKKDGMKSTRRALHESIAHSELQARMIAEQSAANNIALENEDEEHVSVTAEALVAAQSPGSVEESLDAPDGFEDQVSMEVEDQQHDQPEGTELEGEETIEDHKTVLSENADETEVKKMPADPADGAGAGALRARRSKGKKAAANDTSAAVNSPDPLMRKQRKVAKPPAPLRNDAARVIPAVIPTPPTSDQGAHLLTTQQSNVDDWLAGQSQEPPVPPEDLDESVHSAKTFRKRKQNSGEAAEADFELPPGEVAPHDSGSQYTAASASDEAEEPMRGANKRARDNDDMASETRPKKRKSNGKSPEKSKRRVTMSGPFTQEEKELADKIFDSVMQKDGLSSAQLIAQVQNWKTCGRFKTDMVAAFSDRTVDSVRKFCQRRYHGQQRGPWTSEDDEALRSAYARCPGQWTAISDFVGRTAPDCNDRWRNHLESDQFVVGPWTVEEEEQLLAAVEECIDEIKKENRDDRAFLRDRERLEAMINWRVVADKLEGKRTTKRCREKYFKLRASQAKAKNQDVPRSTAQRARDDAESAKVVQARRALNNFEIGDYYDVFVEIHSSFEDPHQHFRDEKHVLWSIVSAKNMHSRFSLSSYPSTLRRVALEHAIANWPAANARIKRRLESVDAIPAKALVLARWVEKTNAGKLDAITRTYQTQLIGKTKDEIEAIRKAHKEKYAQGPRKNNGKSRDYVTESEDDADPEDIAAPFPASKARCRIPAGVLDEEECAHESDDDVRGGRENDEPGDGALEEDEEPSDVTQQVPDTQFEQNDFVMSDLESLKGTPNVAPSDFVDRLKSSGGSRKRKFVGYGKKDRLKTEKSRNKAR
ncbi:hypothetical protein CERZMDRAFT_96378 [Cercospora zeae-maydis SCOH1-5]|uniref:DNA-binding protein REB1 n=1 Tax=Cercospora zeae-maydis SCOH1-5 TaxID=717836 RepID=A0A6A6FJC6_9PEZI|nr:hypothetical protein CERZMDRAFT_96378 [Cercospora zeae-maydis SCOH1-5]